MTRLGAGAGFLRSTAASTRPSVQPTGFRGSALLGALLVLSAPAFATSRCPPEFGPKDPLVDVMGWLVLAAGGVAGALLFAWLMRRTRGMRWMARSAVLFSGGAGTLVVWVGALAVAYRQFFLRC